MARPVRSRRAPLKFSEDENIVEVKSRNSNNKITEIDTENKESSNVPTKSVAAKSKSEKGILLAGKKTLIQISSSPVLRDRTNLPAETFKSDILMKKGTDENTTKKTTQATRLNAKRMANEDIESQAPSRAKRLRLAKDKDHETAVETTGNLPLRKERTRKAVTEKENTGKALREIENTEKAVPEKENTGKALTEKDNTRKALRNKQNIRKANTENENTENASPEKENTEKALTEKENTGKALRKKENIRKAGAEKEDTGNASPEKENTEKALTERENTGKALRKKENIRKASAENKNTENVSPEKENTGKALRNKQNIRKAGAEKENTENAFPEEENTGKALTEKENTGKALTEKENTGKVLTEKVTTGKALRKKENIRKANTEKETPENASPAQKNTEKTPDKENPEDMPVAKEKLKNVAAKGKAKSLRVKAASKKLKEIKEASESANEDDSLVVESENAGDSQNPPKVRSAKAMPRKIGRKVALSKLSLSQKANKSVENRKKKSLRRSSELRKKAKDEATTSGNKFFKSKGATDGTVEILPGKKIATSKRRKVERPRVSTSFRLRQTTLSESFAKQATKKNLRPRVAQKNYHEATIATDKDETKGPVYKTAKLMEKSDEDGSEIYEFHFDSNDSRERIAKKKKKKKVARNVVTKKRGKASGTKNTISKPKVATKNAGKENKVENLQPVIPAASNIPTDVPAIVINDFDISPLPGKPENAKMQPKRLEPQPERVESLKTKPKVVESLELSGDMKINLTSTPQLTKSSENNSRPLRTTNAFNLPRPSVQYRTMLNHVLLNKSLSPIKKDLENFDPGSPWRPPVFTGPQFSRVKNVVQSTPQVRKFSTMLASRNSGLETKTEAALVDINKVSEKDEKNADEQTNSKTAAKMNKITENEENNENDQQTNIKTAAKVNKVTENYEKNENGQQKNIKTAAKLNKITENDEKSENVQQKNIKSSGKVNKIAENDEKSENVEQINTKPQKVLGLAKSPRKFGTVISNVNVAISGGNSVAIRENNGKLDLNRGSPRKNPIVASPRLAELSDTRISDYNDFDDHADKENSIPVFTSPKKSLKSPKKLGAKQSPLRASNQAKIATKENWEPQPGPSGLQKRSPLGESRILRQSNLNNFLNIDEVPTSTRISTAHGIFADAHSTPIPGKPVKIITTEANVENAFGFDDIGENDVDLSPIKSDLFADPPAAKVAKNIFAKRTKIEGKKDLVVPSRFSIGEIKKHLRPAVSKDKVDPGERREKDKDERREKREDKAGNDKGEDPVTFSDTFDLLTAAAQANDEENAQEVPLFADLEPVHFKQPPRHSYKRKRIVAFNFSEDEEENEDRESHERLDNTGTKKRKISKVEKQRQKQMEEWAKGLNNTFEEIEHFDLVVEKQ